MHKFSKLGLVSMCLCAVTQGQELTLFEPVESAPTPDKAVPLVQSLTNQNGQPAFTVRGMSHIGGVFKAILIDRSGQEKQVTWQPGQVAEVPGAPGFVVSNIGPRSVTLTQPASDPCVASVNVGVSCHDAATAQLMLATASPLPPKAQAAPQPAQVGGNPNLPTGDPQNPFEAAIRAQQAAAQQGNQPATFVNPFTGQTEAVDKENPALQQAREDRQRARAERLGRFESQRIPDNQVPQGMRKVSTPFGDRLVPIQ